ncbi:MAG: NAD(+) diphosphatase, partial [Marmoricola sp.]
MSAEIALSRHPHDRVAERRTDEAWLAEVWADDENTRVLVVAGTRVQLGEAGLAWISPCISDEGIFVIVC